MVTNKKILVTGGTSALGGALQALVERGEYPGREFLFSSSKECDLLDRVATERYIEKHQPDAIIHFAVVLGDRQSNIDHPATVLRDNIAMNFNLAEAARKAGVKKVAMTLSTIIYPPHAPLPLKESSLHDGYPHESHYAYVFAKRMIDPMIRAYREEYGLVMIGLVPNIVIGEQSNFAYEKSTVVPALIRRFYEHREDREPLVVWGDGTAEREITYSEDIARAFMWAVDHYDGIAPLNIGTTEALSVKEMAFAVADALGIDKTRIVFDASKGKGASKIPTDNTSFLKLSDFTYIPTQEAIRKVAAYFAASYPDPKKLRLSA